MQELLDMDTDVPFTVREQTTVSLPPSTQDSHSKYRLAIKQRNAEVSHHKNYNQVCGVNCHASTYVMQHDRNEKNMCPESATHLFDNGSLVPMLQIRFGVFYEASCSLFLMRILGMTTVTFSTLFEEDRFALLGKSQEDFKRLASVSERNASFETTIRLLPHRVRESLSCTFCVAHDNGFLLSDTDKNSLAFSICKLYFGMTSASTYQNQRPYQGSCLFGHVVYCVALPRG